MSRFPAVRPGSRRAAVLSGLVALLVCLPACLRPQVPACPLDPCAVLARVRAERRPPPAPGLTLAEATAVMRRHNPKIREARAAWRTAQAVACTPTPLENPTLGVGPLLLGGFDVLDAAWGLEAALGWTVLLADTRSLEDDVNAVRASAALAEAAAVERAQYLALRSAYVETQHASALREAREALAAAARTAQEVAETAVDAGSATVLDARLLGLEAAEIEAELIDAEEAEAEARGELGARLGVAALGGAARTPTDPPAPPPAVPSLAELQALVVRHHPALCVLRAEYLVAEKELRLEVARAWPTLDMGLTYEREDGDRFGLPLGIELPIFDRNQPAIAQATARRQEGRERYTAALGEILAEVEAARVRVEHRQRRLALYDAQIAPAEETRRLAEEVLQQTGAFDMLRYLEVLRATRRARVEELASRAALYAAWSELEQACGAPLLQIPAPPPAPSARTPAPAVPDERGDE